MKSNLDKFAGMMAKQGKEAVVLRLTVLISGSLAAGGLWYPSKQTSGLPGNPAGTTSPRVISNGGGVENRLSRG